MSHLTSQSEMNGCPAEAIPALEMLRSGSGYAAPKQDRSRHSTERILRAAEQLVGTCDFDEVSLLAIADEAEVSQGTLYARFRTKANLLAAVQEHNLKLATRQYVEHFEAQETKDLSVRERVFDVIHLTVVDIFQRRQSSRNFRRAGLVDPRFLQRQAAGDRQHRELCLEGVLKYLPGGDCIETRLQVERGIRMVLAVIRDLVDTGDPFDSSEDQSPERIARNLTDMATRCVDAASAIS